MTAEDDAYRAAEALIAKAKADGADRLSLDTPETRALTRLPPEIAHLLKLQNLDLQNTQITDLTPLIPLNGLRRLSLSNTPITDLRPVVPLTGLGTLFLGNTRITDFTPLAAMTGLRALYLANTQITDLLPLTALVGLGTLSLDNTQIIDFTPLTALNRLSALSLANTQITDLTPLAALTPLLELSLANTPITDLTPLIPLTGLSRLHLGNTPIADLTPVTALVKLRALFLTSTKITDLTPLTALTGLRELYLDNTQITDLTPLTALSRLGTLSLDNTQIKDLTPLTALNELRTHFLDDTPIIDFRPLSELTRWDVAPFPSGLSFQDTLATRADPRIAEIAAIEDPAIRARELFAYLETWVPPGEAGRNIEAVLQGPILSDSLTDVTKPVDRFEATSLTDTAERPIDDRHGQLLQTVQLAAHLLGRAEVQNRIGRDVAESFAEYARFAEVTPTNPRVLNYLANSVRAALLDVDTAIALDGFDKGRISGFLTEHDSLIRDYYPAALSGPKFEAETDPEVLVRELFPKLASARDILRKADQDGLFAPSVSDALEMLYRRAEGAKRRYLTSGDPGEKAQAAKELQRISVLVTAYIGRINARVTQWINKQVQKAKEDPVDGMLRGAGLLEIAQGVVSSLKPVFDFLWTLIGNLPLPF